MLTCQVMQSHVMAKLTSPSFLASSVISMNFWISEMVGPVKSSTGIIVCFRLKGINLLHDNKIRCDNENNDNDNNDDDSNT